MEDAASAMEFELETKQEAVEEVVVLEELLVKCSKLLFGFGWVLSFSLLFPNVVSSFADDEKSSVDRG